MMSFKATSVKFGVFLVPIALFALWNLCQFQFLSAAVTLVITAVIGWEIYTKLRHFSLRGRTCLITGGAAGIGYNLAKALVYRNVNVILWDRDAQKLDVVVKKLRQKAPHAKVKGRAVDVRNHDDIKCAADEIRAAGIDLSVIINCAGVAAGNLIQNTTASEIDHQLDVNLKGVMFTSREFLPDLFEHSSGTMIVSICSLMGCMGAEKLSAYSASKHGLFG